METGREKTEGQDYKCICRDRTQIDQTDMGTLLGRLRVKKNWDTNDRRQR